MKTIWRIYFGRLRYWHRKFLPLLEIGKTQETEYPFRWGRSLVFRIPFTEHGYYVGLLFNSAKDPRSLTDEDVDLLILNAMRGRTAWTPKDGKYDEFF